MSPGPGVADKTAFLTDALGAALELAIATPEDVLRFATPDVLAASLPRPLWGRLLTACLGSVRVDAALVVETVTVPNLCEHVSPVIVWGCIATVGVRALGNPALVPSVTTAVPALPAFTLPAAPPAAATSSALSVPVPPAVPRTLTPLTPPAASSEWARGQSTPVPTLPLAPPPPPAGRDSAPDIRSGSKPSVAPATVAVAPAASTAPASVTSPSPPVPAPSPTIEDPATNPLAELDVDLDDDPIAPPPPAVATVPSRTRGNTRQPLRQSSTNSGVRGTAHTTARRPQAAATPTPATTVNPVRRGATEISDYEIATDVRSADDYRTPGNDELVEWSSSEETLTTGDELDRKR